MKISNVIKVAIKWAPVIYPVVKKIIDSKNGPSTTSTKRK